MEAILWAERAMIDTSLVHAHLNRILLVCGVITIQRPCPNLS